MNPSQFTFRFPAETSVLEKVGQLIENAGQLAGMDRDEIGDIQIAVDEACTNTIIHGLKKDPNLTFDLVIEWKHHAVKILIHENGEPFDLTAVKNPETSTRLEERPIGGLGMHLIKKLMDDVAYSVNDNGTKTFRMIKAKKS